MRSGTTQRFVAADSLSKSFSGISTLVPRIPKGFSCLRRELNSRHFHYTVSNCTETKRKRRTQTPIHRLDQPSPQGHLASPWKARRAWGRGWVWVWTIWTGQYFTAASSPRLFPRKRAAPIFLGKRAGGKVEYTIIFGF